MTKPKSRKKKIAKIERKVEKRDEGLLKGRRKLLDKKSALEIEEGTVEEKLRLLRLAGMRDQHRTIVKALKDKNPEVRSQAVRLAAAHQLDAILMKAAKDENYKVATEAIAAATALKYPDVLGAALKNKNVEVRKYLLNVVKLKRKFISRRLAFDLMKDKNPEIRKEAKKLYEKLKDER